MIFISSKVGLLLVVFTLQLANGELEKDSTEAKPASEKAKLRDWFFRLSLRNDLINLKKEGQDYLPVVKLRSEDGEGEDFSILLDKDHPHPDNKCASQSASQDKEMRFVMRGLDQEFMCTEINKKVQDVPEERSMFGTDGSRGDPGTGGSRGDPGSDGSRRTLGTGGKRGFSRGNFIKAKDHVEEGEKQTTTEQSEMAGDDSEPGEEGTDEDIDQVLKVDNIANVGTSSVTTEVNVEVEPVVVTEKEEAEVFAKVIDDKNETKSMGALDPLIDHLNGVASHKRFQDPFYVKAIQDLVEDFRKHNLSEATWDQDKLNTILDKIEELVTGNAPDNSQIEVIKASDDLQLLSEDVEKIEQELEALPLIVPEANPTSRPDISAVSQSLDQLMINLQNFADTESPEGRMSGSQNDGRVGGEKTSSAGVDKKAAAIEQVIEDLREFVDVSGIQRSAGDSEDGRGSSDSPDERSAVNGTSGESPGNATNTENLEQVNDGEYTGNATNTENQKQVNDGESTGNTTNTEELEKVNDGESTGNTTNTEELEKVNDGESPGNATNTENQKQVNDGESPGSDTTTKELEKVDEQTTLLSSDSLTTEESATEEDAQASVTETSEEKTSVSNGSVTTGNAVLNESTTGDSLDGSTMSEISTTKNPLNDTDENGESIYGSEGLIGMLTSWKQKFFIILGCFIVSMVLFLIIIAVLIYKIQQNKPNRDATK